MKITLDWLKTRNMSIAGMNWFEENYGNKEISPVDVIEKLKAERMANYAFWLGMHTLPLEEAISLMLEMVREILPIYEEVFPKDKILRETLDAAESHSKTRSYENQKKLEKMIHKTIDIGIPLKAAAVRAAVSAAAYAADAANAANIAKVAAISASAAAAAAAADAVVNAAAAAAAAAAADVINSTKSATIYACAACAAAAAVAEFDAAGPYIAIENVVDFNDKYIDKMLEIIKKKEKE